MDPITMALIGGTLLQGLGGLFGAHSQDKAQKRAVAAQQRRQAQMETEIRPRLDAGPGAGEDFLTKLLSGGGWGTEESNAGQDSLMQMLRADTFDPTKLFESWNPIEKRALDDSLAQNYSSSTGLGQRYGSAMATQEGKIRGQAAEGAASRREEATMNLYSQGQDRKSQIAQFLSNLGLQQNQQQIGAATTLGSLEQGRNQQNNQLLQMLFGQPVATQGPSAMPGAIGDVGQLAAMLPMLIQMMGQGGGGQAPNPWAGYSPTGAH